MHKCRIRLLSNRASVSLELCNTSVFRGFHILCSSLVARPHLSIRVCVSVCHILLLVYLLHLRICESLSTLLTLANILHQIFCATILTELHYKPYLCRCEKPTRIGTNCVISLLHIEWSLIHLQHRSRYIWYWFFFFSHSHIFLWNDG